MPPDHGSQPAIQPPSRAPKTASSGRRVVAAAAQTAKPAKQVSSDAAILIKHNAVPVDVASREVSGILVESAATKETAGAVQLRHGPGGHGGNNQRRMRIVKAITFKENTREIG